MIEVRKSPLLRQYKMHRHQNWEVILNVQGEGTEIIGSEPMPFGPGSISLCPPNTLHGKFISESGSPWQDLSIILPTPLHLPPHPLWMTDDAAHTVERLMLMLLDLSYQSDTHALQAAGLMLDALVQLMMQRITPALSPVTETIKRHIVLHHTDISFDLSAVYPSLNYAPDHIRRVFKKDMGISPHQYLLSIRLEHAKRLLLSQTTPQYTIREVALYSGFDDPNYFCRLFHRKNGVSPSDYRESSQATTA